MLTHLHIRNYALISELDIDFEAGFSVLTGETGAGKSIILGALNLVMGGRADTRAITEGEERCIIEAEFRTPVSPDLIIRRELNQNGRSRSLVNDEVVTQSELKTLASALIDIHSQHANLLMADDTFQLSVLDAIAFSDTSGEALLQTYTAQYDRYCAARDALFRLREEAKKAQQEADYVQFQYEQLRDANLQPGEQESLEQEEYRLAHAEDIRERLHHAYLCIEGDDTGVLNELRTIHLDTASDDLAQRIESVRIELHDIAEEARRAAEQTESSPERLQQVQDRCAFIQQLLHKHHLSTIEELIVLRNQLEEQCQRIATYDEDIARGQEEMNRQEEQLCKAARQLTDARLAVREKVSQALISRLQALGIAHARMEVSITPLPDYTPSGKDNVQFLFAANLNQSLRRVSEVASGGEISRIMLCIKALMASTRGLPTIIFDEIDTGISGEVATQMGRIMREMAQSRQIIAITHLPQIAAAAQRQYHVYKQDTDRRTETHIRALQDEERVHEIASMVAGHNLTEASVTTARELLKNT